jgi:hypothetical protein
VFVEKNLHSAESKYNSNGHLLLPVHLQLVHDEDGHNTESPIRDTGQCRVSIEGVDDDVRRDAFTLSTTELFPEEGNWPALEGKDEEEVHGIYLNGDKRHPENDAVGLLNRDTQQEDTNTHLEEKVRCNIGRFAAPPPL